MKSARSGAFGVALLLCAPGADAALEMSGNSSISVHDNDTLVDVAVDQVCNTNSGGTSGTLYIDVWYTLSSNPAGSGYRGARLTLGQLSAGFCFNNVSYTNQAHTPPPDGTYYVHLLLVEYPNTSTFVDSITFSNRFTFDAPDPVPEPPGGGGLGVLTLGLLAAGAGMRRRPIA